MFDKLRSNAALILFAALLGLGVYLSDIFLTWPNILNILTASATIGLLSIGAAFVIGSGGLDLSVGSLIALSATVSVVVSTANSALIIVVCLGTGIAAGAANGVLIGVRSLPPFIVTLATLSLARGAALILADGRPVYGLPAGIVWLGQGRAAGIPVPVVVFLGCALLSQLVLLYTRFGCHTLALGDNEAAARAAGIRVVRQKVSLYALSGGLAALAGLLFMGRVNAADPSAGVMYELTAITAAVIGGTSLKGGRTSVAGAALGAVIMGVLQNELTLINMPSYYQQVAIGLTLVVAVELRRVEEADAP